ncbi:MAG TPA: glycosyltransferase family A protein [Pyrinomonadaceae bacterium]|jgi:glycosyltransferase involved in cell wall biosynthesis
MTPETSTQGAPLVSVVVPAYNYGHFLPQTLESLQAQTYPRWECIVVDDGSSDDTPEVMKAFADADRRVRYVRQENRGLGESRNTGIRHARGDYFQFLDADDTLEPLKFELQVGQLEASPGVDIVYGGVRYFTTENPGARRLSLWGPDEPWMPGVSGTKEVLLALVRDNVMPVNAPLLRKSVVEEIGFFDKEPLGVEDWDYWLRCALAGKRFAYRDEEGTRALVRAHPTSMSCNRVRMRRSALMVRKKLFRARLPEDARRLNRGLFSAEAGELGIEEAVAGNAGVGARHLLEAAVRSPRATTKGRWAACALVAPFVRDENLRLLAVAPPAQFCRLLLRQIRDRFRQ